MDGLADGTLVQLKSGGPVMTTDGRDINGDHICVWFDKNGICQKHVFTAAALVPATQVTSKAE